MKKILYVEDEPVNAFIVKKMLQKYYEVDIVYDGLSCLQMFQKNKYDLVLMDINLGEENNNGGDVVQKLRTLPNGNSVKVVAVTAFASPNDKHLFISQGFDEYLAKPIEDVALLSLVKFLVK